MQGSLLLLLLLLLALRFGGEVRLLRLHTLLVLRLDTLPRGCPLRRCGHQLLHMLRRYHPGHREVNEAVRRGLSVHSSGRPSELSPLQSAIATLRGVDDSEYVPRVDESNVPDLLQRDLVRRLDVDRARLFFLLREDLRVAHVRLGNEGHAGAVYQKPPETLEVAGDIDLDHGGWPYVLETPLAINS